MKKYSAMRKFGDMSFEFAGVHTQHELFALTVPEAAARWLEAQDERTQMREAFRLSGCEPTALPPDYPAAKRSVLAVAIGNDSTAYVIHTDDRFPDDHFGFERERVMVLHRRAGQWRIDAQMNLLRPGNMSFGMSECPKGRKK
jgi:hypothetical protein